MITKSQLAIRLSRLAVFDSPKVKLEQYETPSQIASDLLWIVHFNDDNVEGKVIVDLGCGTGILGIGALLLGAKKVYFVDVDDDALEILKQNLEEFEDEEFDYEIIKSNVLEMEPIKADVVLTNPPFGTRQKHIDKEFLTKAFECASYTYSLHKTSTLKHLREWVPNKGLKCINLQDFSYELKATQKFHTRRIHRIDVSTLRSSK